jgi:hypothetical protein
MRSSPAPAAAVPPAGQGADRRRSERRPHVIDAWLSPASPGRTGGRREGREQHGQGGEGDRRNEARYEVVAMDLSRHGVGFGMEQPLPVGSFHVIEIGFGEQRLVAEIRIVSCRPLDEQTGLFQIGAEFC